MKAILLSLSLITSTQAMTLDHLQTPPSTTTGGIVATCAGTQFDATDTLHGYCQTFQQGPNGSRGSHPTYTWTIWATSWSNTGELLNITYCGAEKATWVYAPGFSATNCQKPPTNTGPYVLINSAWFTITAYSTDGAYEAVVGNGGGAIVAF